MRVALAALTLTNKMLCACLNTCALDPMDGLSDKNTRQVGVGTAYLLVSIAQGRSTEQTDRRTQSYMGTFTSELCAHVLSALADQRLIPGSDCGDTSREHRDGDGLSNSDWSVLETETAKTQSFYWRDATNTGARFTC
jgi:hypothetical protein